MGRKKNMKFRKADDGVSEVVGTVLLLGMAVTLFSLLCFTVLSYPTSSAPPSANLVATVEGNNITIEHRGGESLTLDTQVIVNINGGDPMSIIIGDENYLNSKVKEDNLWGIGECLIYHPDISLSGRQVKITVIDIESNSVIMAGSLQNGEEEK